MYKALKALMLPLLFPLLAACGGGDGFKGGSGDNGGNGGTDGGGTVTGATISLGANQVSVKTDNSNSTTITATVLDENKAVVPDVEVTFSASGGQLSASKVATDASGKAVVMFSSGTSDPSNRVATVTASATGVAAAQIPIQISGSTVAISSDTTSLILGGAATANITVTAKNAGGLGVYNSPVTLSVTGVGSTPGAATLSAASGVTDVTGELDATVTGASPGTVRLTVTALGVSTSKDFTVTSSGSAFQISVPASTPASLAIGSNLTVTVSAPGSTNVRFVTTLGDWDASGNSVIVKAVAGGTASAVLRSAVNGGVANVQVFDAADITMQDSLTVLVAAPAANASSVTLQSDVSAVAPSTGSLSNQAVLTATVKDASQQPVQNAPVVFSMANSTGGGESLSVAYGVSDAAGQVTTTFTSGTLSSTQQGVKITATVLDSGGSPLASADKYIVVGGASGSVVVGGATVVSELDPATYSYPMSVLVADTNGNAVAGATVTLSAWPAYYATGVWRDSDPDPQAVLCVQEAFGVYPNEDANENLTLDAGEDVGPGEDLRPNGALDTITFTDNGDMTSVSEDINGNGILNLMPDRQLTPANSAGGNAPRTLVTDSNGVATFNLTYLKTHGGWIKTRIRASTRVFGTETTGTTTFWLKVEREEAEECLLPHSPFNPAGL